MDALKYVVYMLEFNSIPVFEHLTVFLLDAFLSMLLDLIRNWCGRNGRDYQEGEN